MKIIGFLLVICRAWPWFSVCLSIGLVSVVLLGVTACTSIDEIVKKAVEVDPRVIDTLIIPKLGNWSYEVIARMVVFDDGTICVIANRTFRDIAVDCDWSKRVE